MRKKGESVEQFSKRYEKLPEYARRIWTARRFAKMDQKELAAILGVNQSVVSRWERGEYPPSAESYALLGNLFWSDALWFWRQAGMDERQLLIVAAREIQRAGVKIKAGRGAEPDFLRWIYLHELQIAPPGEKPHREVFVGGTEVSVKQAARILSVEAEDVLGLVKSGFLLARRIVPQGMPVVDYESVIDYAQKRGHRGRERLVAWEKSTSKRRARSKRPATK